METSPSDLGLLELRLDIRFGGDFRISLPIGFSSRSHPIIREIRCHEKSEKKQLVQKKRAGQAGDTCGEHLEMPHRFNMQRLTKLNTAEKGRSCLN